MMGVVEIFVQSGDEEVVIDYLGKGSVIGQYSVLSHEKCLFGMRAVKAGSTSILCLDRETFESMRMKRQEVDQALLAAEDYIDKQGVPQIDFVLVNENSDKAKEDEGLSNINDHSPFIKSKETLKKFRRTIRRLVLLSRVAIKQGNTNFDIGGLIFQIN